MSNTLLALMTKIQWQLQTLSQQLLETEQQQLLLTRQLEQCIQQIENACDLPARIIPEKEIARLNFIMQCQQQRDELDMEKKEVDSLYLQHKTKQKRLNIELKMMEKYLENHQIEANRIAQTKEQNNLDEWILLQGNDHANNATE